MPTLIARHGPLPAHAYAGCAAWPGGLGRCADTVVGGRDDRGRVNDPAHGYEIWQPGRSAAVDSAGHRSVASLAVNVAVAEPSATGGVIAAWPSLALISSCELLMRGSSLTR
jgi:hypothetical protein